MSDMNGTTSTSPKDGDYGAIYTVWNGYDVVLHGNIKPGGAAEAAATTRNRTAEERRQHRHSLRRLSTGLREDYGWLRQIDLRSDMPTIDEVHDWSFDVLQFEDAVLVIVFVLMLEYYNLLDFFRVDRKTLERYCKEVMDMHNKDCYYQKIDIEIDGVDVLEKSTPEVLCEYHNWYHAVSGAHVCFLFLTLKGADAFLNPIDVFCILMGALIHDLDHQVCAQLEKWYLYLLLPTTTLLTNFQLTHIPTIQGTNNEFEVRTRTSLAKLYNNDSVLERHSINTGLNMCRENPDLDWLKSFNDNDREHVHHFISEVILATDPARHGEILQAAFALVDKSSQCYESTSIIEVTDIDSDNSPPTPKTFFKRNDPQHRLFIGRLLLHSADISNPVHSSFQVASDWAIRMAIEFTKQAEKEQQLKLPVTTYMDGLDSQYKIAKMQIGSSNLW